MQHSTSDQPLTQELDSRCYTFCNLRGHDVAVRGCIGTVRRRSERSVGANHTLIADLARDGIAYVPFFPLGGFTPLQSSTLSDVATRLGATPTQVALAWLLQQSANILVIPGTSSIEQLRKNLQASTLQIPPEVIADLDAIR